MEPTLAVPGDMSGVTFLDAASLKHFNPQQILAQMLSTKAYISTDTSQDDTRPRLFQTRGMLSRMLPNKSSNATPHLKAARELGAGMCGVVHAVTGTEWAIKLARPSAGKADELYEDFCTHLEVQEAFDRLPSTVRPAINIPRVRGWIHPDNDQFWKSYQPCLPANTPRNYGLVSTRITPLPEPVRRAVWEHFAPPNQRKRSAAAERALAESRNQDCLVRVYLGRRKTRIATANVQLRNFELALNEIEDLGLDARIYAEAMAGTLALLHWRAGVDANDVEFVLGSAPLVRPRAPAAEYRAVDKDGARFLEQPLDFTRRSVGLWLLDFNQCRRFPHSPAGLKQIVDGFRWNDPYYPRPGGTNAEDEKLWKYFEKVYLLTSAHLDGPRWMAQAFIEEVKSLGAKKVDVLF